MCLSPKGMQFPHCSSDRRIRTYILSSLPYRQGGLGIARMEDRADAAFIAGIISASRDPLFRNLRPALSHVVGESHASLLKILHIKDNQPGHSLSHIIPPSASQLLSGSFCKHFHLNHPKCKPQAAIRRVQCDMIRFKLRGLTRLCEYPSYKCSDNDEDAKVPTATSSDIVHLDTLVLRSQASRVFAAPLWRKHSRIPGPLFIRWCRSHVGMSLPVRNGAVLKYYS